jgi:hypothetical protein
MAYKFKPTPFSSAFSMIGPTIQNFTDTLVEANLPKEMNTQQPTQPEVVVPEVQQQPIQQPVQFISEHIHVTLMNCHHRLNAIDMKISWILLFLLLNTLFLFILLARK